MIILKGRVVGAAANVLSGANHNDDGVCQSSPTKLDVAIWVFCLHETVSVLVRVRSHVLTRVHGCTHALRVGKSKTEADLEQRRR